MIATDLVPLLRYHNIPLDDRLLLMCLAPGALKAKRLSDVNSVHWRKVLDRSRYHGVSPLLFHRLKQARISDDQIGWVRNRLEKHFHKTAAKNIRLYHFLSPRLKAISRAGIPVILLKGAHLAERVYGNIALRPMSDVDLLLHRRDLVRAQEALQKAGYSPFSGEVLLDLHWHPAHSITEIDIDPISNELAERIEIDGIWERSEEAVIAGEPVRVMCSEDLLLHLCIHLAVFHLFRYHALRGLCDIRETMVRYANRLSWERVAERAEAWGIGNAVALCLRLARDLLDAPLPDSLPNVIDPDDIGNQAVDGAIGAMFGSSPDAVPVSPKLWQLFHFGTVPSRLRMGVRLLLPSPQCIPRRFGRLTVLRSYLAYYDRLRLQLMRHLGAVRRVMAPRGPSDEQGKEATEMKSWLCSRKNG